MSYLKDDFLLQNKYARKLYFGYAKDMPIFDYHCHLPEKQILENKQFDDIFQIWLAGDHYKWRLMRNYGIDEELITGNASNYDKFVAYCTVLGTAFGNPLYHWSQLELKAFFDCDLEINADNAEKIWNCCNSYIASHNVTPQSLIEQSNVKYVFTTNEIFDDLTTFREIAQKDYKFKVIPAFRADKIMNIDADAYNTFVDKLGEVKTLADLQSAIESRLKEFIKVGTVASDIALQAVYPVADFASASKVYSKRRSGKPVTEEESEIFKGYLTYYLMKLYSRYDIRTELHIGAMRNNNSVMFAKLGADTGFDTIAEDNSTAQMAKLFDKLNSENSLPKTIVFNLNPKMNAELVTLIGCFQDSSACGKLQYGPAWWFLDNKVGMEKHLQDLTATGHLAAFVGMLTDSRSLLSYPRHHYFRRILCNYLGTLIARKEITQNLDFVGKVVQNICYDNAVKFFGIE